MRADLKDWECDVVINSFISDCMYFCKSGKFDNEIIILTMYINGLDCFKLKLPTYWRASVIGSRYYSIP